MGTSNLLNFFFVFTALCSVFRVIHSQPQEYNGFDNTECIYTVPFGSYGRYKSDLSTYFENDNLAVAFRGIGNWIFYDYAGYEGVSETMVLRQRSLCVPLQVLASRVSSMRFAGDPSDYSAPSITLYEGTDFRGKEIYITDDNPKALFGTNLDSQGGWSDKFGSLIVTGGPSACWTLYYAIGYMSTASSCICGGNSTDFAPLLVRNNPFPPFNMVGSVKKGCVAVSNSKLQIPPGFNSEGLID